MPLAQLVSAPSGRMPALSAAGFSIAWPAARPANDIGVLEVMRRA